MSDYIKLAEAPAFIYENPKCGACYVELGDDDGNWMCPCCGTSWGSDAYDGEYGELYESWAGEELDGEPLDDDAAGEAGRAHKREADKALYKRWGWCEHGFPGKCWHNDCQGGTR